jgi:hypothetical protein
VQVVLVMALPLLELTPNRINPMIPLKRIQRSGGWPSTLTLMMMSVLVLEAPTVVLDDIAPRSV